MATDTTTTITTITTTIITTKNDHGVGSITLNRPQALNALDLPMFEAVRAFLDDCARDPAIRGIVIRGNGDRGFCSGGDVKKVATENVAYGRRFFELEYGTDHELHRYPKPVAVLAQGITMGGGLGLFAGGRVRVCADDAVLAMPEVSIGFFTDVGATWFLNQMPGNVGLFLGMTGARFGAWDALYLGLATAIIARADLEEAGEAALRGELESWLAEHALARVSALASGEVRERSWVARNQAWLDAICVGDDAEAVYRKLLAAEAPGGERAITEALANLRAGSPDSARLIFRELKAARGRSIADCFARELELALARMAHPEFREGVRARLIDKDHQPRWAN